MTRGNVQNREAFLDHLTAKLGRKERITKEPEFTFQKNPQYEIFHGYSQDELVGHLREEAKSVTTDVYETETKGLAKTIEEILDRYEAKSIVSWDDPRMIDFQIESLFDGTLKNKGIESHIWNQSLGRENIDICEQADVGITFCDVALAESATVVLFSDRQKSRSVSLLPKTYIALIPKSKIVPRLTQASEIIQGRYQEQQRMPSCINFITGPSNSGDIEMNLVVGVHGPIKVSYVIVNDQ